MNPTLRWQSGAAATGRVRQAARIAAGLIAKAAAGLSRQAMNRRVLHKLGVMSDRELKDIGLVRQDIADAATSAGDASLLLLARRDERRIARRRSEGRH